VFSVWCLMFGETPEEPNMKSLQKSMVQPYLNMDDVVKPNVGLNGDLGHVVEMRRGAADRMKNLPSMYRPKRFSD